MATATTEIYTYGHPLAPHDALPSSAAEHARQPSAERRASPVFCRDFLQHGIVEHGVRQQPFEPGVLLLEHLQLARLRHVHAAILGLPRVQRRAADAVLATHIGGLHPAFLLAQHRDDLLLAEPGLPHVRLLTKARSEEHTSELQSLMRISYAVFCLKKKKQNNTNHPTTNSYIVPKK